MQAKLLSPNLKLDHPGNEVVLWNKVMKEVKLGRYAGPFAEIPFEEHYIQSPIGLVPKDNGTDSRLIFHLSYPKRGNKSVNANTPAELCTVTYPDFNQAIELCLKEGKNCKISRSDMKAAFRNLCIRKQDYWLLIMKAQSPIDGRTYYFVDKCLPIRASISCSHFQRFSNCVAYIVKVRTGKSPVNYLDDYLFAAFIKYLCDAQVQEFISICQYIAFPVNMEKTFWGTTKLTFLGLMIDTVLQMVFVPVDKVDKAIAMIDKLLAKKKATVKQLQQLAGFS